MSAFVQGRSFATFFAILISESLSNQTIQSQSGERQYYAYCASAFDVLSSKRLTEITVTPLFRSKGQMFDRIITARSRTRSFIPIIATGTRRSDSNFIRAERMVVHIGMAKPI
jgi:hypothetical protein